MQQFEVVYDCINLNYLYFSVELMIKLGAIPFCRTNLPQCILSFDCKNPIYGQTTHPLDLSRTPGGSSGGEAALVALGGSIIGIGTIYLIRNFSNIQKILDSYINFRI